MGIQPILHKLVYLKVQQVIGLQEMSPEPQDARLSGRKKGAILTATSVFWWSL